MAKNKQTQEGLEGRLKESFGKLKAHVGKKVQVDYVWYGQPHSEKSTLRSVEDYVNIAIEGSGIPFVGCGSAIRRVTDAKGNVLYENPNISENYDVRTDEEREGLVALSFGKDVAERFKQARVKDAQEREQETKRLNADAQTKTQEYLEGGRVLVGKDKVEDWRKYVETNTKDFYSAGVIDASLRVMKALSEGKTPKQAEQVIDEMGITGYMAGCMAQAVSHFHPRGEEFREYWNGQYMSKTEAKKSKGVVNPAVLTIRAR